MASDDMFGGFDLPKRDELEEAFDAAMNFSLDEPTDFEPDEDSFSKQIEENENDSFERMFSGQQTFDEDRIFTKRYEGSTPLMIKSSPFDDSFQEGTGKRPKGIRSLFGL